MKNDIEIEFHNNYRKRRSRLYLTGFFSMVFLVLGSIFLVAPYYNF